MREMGSSPCGMPTDPFKNHIDFSGKIDWYSWKLERFLSLV